jgi:hypothetical protein
VVFQAEQDRSCRIAEDVVCVDVGPFSREGANMSEDWVALLFC